MSAPVPVRCPFCSEVIQPEDLTNFAHVRSVFLMHFAVCRKRPVDLTDAQALWVAEQLFEAMSDGWL